MQWYTRVALKTIIVLILLGIGFPEAQAFDQPKAKRGNATKKYLTLADVFPNDRVLDVQITLAKKDWDKIRHQSRDLVDFQEWRNREYFGTPYTYVEASVAIDGVKFPKVKLRKKGFISSHSSSRPSLKIKLKKKDGIEGLTNLTFNNNQQDPTLVSQFMGYGLFNSADSPAPRCAFASVTVNGKHLGVYSHVETMRKPLFKREFGNDKGTLYEGTVLDFYEGWETHFENKFGKDKPGREKIKQLIGALGKKDDDNDYERAIGEFVDLDSFYTYWAVEGLIGFSDGYSGNNNNFFVYLNPETDKLHFLPWGADVVFDKSSRIDNDQGAPISVKTKGIIAHKLYLQTAGRERYARTLKSILAKHWDEKALLAETDRIETMLKPHLGSTQKNHAESLENVRTFIRSRRSDIVAEIADGMPLWARVPEPPAKPKVELRWVEGKHIEGLTDFEMGFPGSENRGDVVYPHKKPALVLTPAEVEKCSIGSLNFGGPKDNYAISIQLTKKARETLAKSVEGKKTRWITVVVDGRCWGKSRYGPSDAKDFTALVGYTRSEAFVQRIADALK